LGEQLGLKKSFVTVVSCILVLALYQNCGPGFGSNSSGLQSLGADFQQLEQINAARRFEAAQVVLQNNCTACHYVGADIGPVTFGTEAEFINAGLVTPGSISSSRLITRLRNYPVEIEGRNMPPTGPLDESDYATLTSWVEGMLREPSAANVFACDPNEPASGLDARRLSNYELYNSLYSILERAFGANGASNILSASPDTFTNRLPEDNPVPFSKSDRSFESTHAQAYFDLAEEIANAITQPNRIEDFVTTYINYNRGACTNLSINNLSSACRDAFIQNFLLRLWGRPVDTSPANNELEAYRAEFTVGVNTSQAINNFTFRALLSPAFLHFVYTDVNPSPSGAARLSSFAIARRLSYHFSMSGLSEEMIQLASTRDLSQDENFSVALNVAAQNAEPMVNDFVEDWLRLYNIFDVQNPNSPKWQSISQGINFNNNLREAMREEILDLANYLYSAGRPVKELLTSNVSFARNNDLMQIYGQNNPAPNNTNENNAIRFPTGERSGIPTRAGYLYNSGDSDNPVVRGVHMMSDFLCTQVRGTIPAEAAMAVPPMGVLTTRDKFEQMTSPSSCVGCHSQINPLGFAYANYNAFGGFQEQEPIFDDGSLQATLPVNATVDLQAAVGENVTVDGGVEFNAWIAESRHFNQCFSRIYHTYNQRLNDRPTTVDSCEMQRLSDVIINNGSLQDFFRAPAADIRFRYRTISQ
jgi:hypothetical protein